MNIEYELYNESKTIKDFIKFYESEYGADHYFSPSRDTVRPLLREERLRRTEEKAVVRKGTAPYPMQPP